MRQARTSEPVFNIPGIILFAIGLCVVAYLAQNYVLDEPQNLWVLVNLAFWPVRFSQGGGFADPAAWVSAVTYSFLHGGFAHIAVNMVWLAAFGSPLAGRIGTVRMAIFWVVTSIASAFAFYAVHPGDAAPLVGASGVISGMMGAAARYGFRRVPDASHRNRSEFAGPLLSIGASLTSRTVLTFLAVWFITNLLAGLVSLTPSIEAANIAWEAHIGGFIVGFFGISLLDRPSPLDALSRPY
ncbi:rhomboid family intramembrane serine protease [Phyllobacterium leguminum]|uniref:Membrane associated rhomboid family serine protease n=1 Tax=Phyllobacterium leguminum TaxID=314237 RepID=A0A318SY13_9HYPH|nr:rhomboid family intramembrane serine protease [Phyllobacterium leguminum]PYE86333.1 membrane associated rhomboid family serine protease [Phyllobacterium leguminum]